MDLGPLRDLVLDLNFSTHGFPVTVTPPGASAITTRGVWLTPLTEEIPAGGEFQKTSARYVLALRRDEVAIVPFGTIVVAPEKAGGTNQTWRVDGVEKIEPDHYRVSLVADS